MTLNVIPSNITFASALRDRATTTRIVIHHTDSAPETTAEQIHQWHLNKGWAGIGYHYVIRGDGGIWQGRPEGKVGAHAYDSATRQANTDGIGITLCGRLDSTPPTSAQMETLVALIKDLQSRYVPSLQVVRHSDVCATACPGALFPWADLQNRLAQSSVPDIIRQGIEAGVIGDPSHKPGDVPDKAFVINVGLNILRKIEGGK